MHLLLLAAALSAAPVPFSIESDPAFWVGTLPQGPGFDANVDLRPTAEGRLRVGVLGYSGVWAGALARAVVLSDAFHEPDWQVRWSGLGLEAQWQLRLGLERGGLQPGLRLQWSQLGYRRGSGPELAVANHGVVTPQLGFQWFPWRRFGLYLLPWAGVQLPVLGTSEVATPEGPRQTRRAMPVLTLHLGWELGS